MVLPSILIIPFQHFCLLDMSGRIALSFHAREKRGEHERSHRRVLWRARHRRNISGIRQGYRCIGIGERECVLVQGGQHVPTNPRSEGHSGLRSRISAYFVTVPDRHAQPCYLHAGHPLPVESPDILLNGHRYRHDPFLPEPPVGCNRQNPIRIATREYTSGGIEASHITGKR